MSIPVDLSGRWGYLTDISSVGAGDAWASGLTVAQRNGSALPLLAHWNGATWTVVDHPWVAPSETGAFTAVSSRSPADVWAAGSHAAGTQSLPMFWHFDGGVWSQVAVPVRNRQCSAGGDISITGIAAAADGVYLSFNCQTGTFQLAGTVQRFSAGRWHAVLKLDSRQIVLGLGLVGQTIWAVGSAWNGTAVQGAAWSGNAAGLTRQPLSLPTGTVFRAVAGNASQVFLAGERNDLGPLPFLMQDTIADGFIATPVPYDRGLSAVTLSENRRAWLAGPTFGGWLGGTPPHAAVLTSPPPR